MNHQKPCPITIPRDRMPYRIKCQKGFQLKRINLKLLPKSKCLYDQFSTILPDCTLPPTKLLPKPSTLTYLNKSGSTLIPYFFLCCRGAMLRHRLHQSPCNRDPSLTPNQLRFRASSHKDVSTANSSGFTPYFE